MLENLGVDLAGRLMWWCFELYFRKHPVKGWCGVCEDALPDEAETVCRTCFVNLSKITKTNGY